MNNDNRLAQLNEWIQETLGVQEFKLTPVSGDASFRRYFRFTSAQQQFVAVDAPPEKENNTAFVNITHLLESEGLPIPHIYYSSLDFGYFLISDLGDELYLNLLDDKNADSLYNKALNALLVIQQTPSASLPKYNQQLLLTEMELFREWYLAKHLNINLTNSENNVLDQVFNALVDNALEQPQIFVHRDYHSRNLMETNQPYPGIIDYQDAVCGPITYDLVSLLRDCYIEWPISQVQTWALGYRQRLLKMKLIENVSEEVFIKWFDLMGIQRQLKAIGIFSRLNLRDHKPNYLTDIPRTINYIQSTAPEYTETLPLYELLQDKLAF